MFSVSRIFFGSSFTFKINFCITSVLQLGMNFDLVRSESMILQVFPFNSEKKRGGVAVKQVNDYP
jgi:magnesium-transporting ATPase (P-type)